MLTKEYYIIEPFTRQLWKGLTFKQVKALSGNKSDNYVHKVLKKFVKENILKEEQIGNSILYSVNPTTATLNLIGFVSECKANSAKHLPHKAIQKIIGKIRQPYFTFIVTGSYARNQQKNTSDLDIVILCDDKEEPKAVMAEIKTECELSIPEVHPYIFTASQFFEMLANKEINYGKETAKNNLIITGAKQYYDILMRAVKNGFNG